MQQLNLLKKDQQFLDDLKRTIINRFWLEDDGYFLEDLSAASIKHRYYSSDWLVVLFTDFLSPSDSSERHYFERSIEYIQANSMAPKSHKIIAGGAWL